MKSSAILFFLLMSLIPASIKTAAAATLDCAGGIVSEGDSRVDVLAKCGQPDARESHDEELIDKTGPGLRSKLFITVEDWTYDFGPTRFTRVITLKNGRVAEIRSGGYGHIKSAGPEQVECTEQVVSPGDLKSDVRAKCGEPFSKDSHEEEVSERLETGRVRRTFVVVEEWTYNLGSHRFMRILTFRNGKLADIRSGGYGYDLKQDDEKRR